MNSRVPVICVDGPSGSGKGTVCRLLMQALGWHLLDSGALYRLVAVAAARQGVALDDEPALARLAAGLDVEFEATPEGAEKILLQRQDVTREVRQESTGEAASRVAALPPVREALLMRQREFQRPPGLVADGRDMGTVIFPDAPLKIFLTASADERARRRHKQLKEMGFDASLARLAEEIRARDERDAGRAVSPLVPAEDAVRVDTTGIPIEGVMAQIRELVQARGLD